LDLLGIIKLSRYIARRYYVDKSLQEDVEQEIAYKVWLGVVSAEARGKKISWRILRMRALTIGSRYILKQRNIKTNIESEIIQEDIGITIAERELMKVILRKLNQIEREIIIKRFGIWGVPRRTLDELATEMCKSVSTIFKVEKRTLKKMRKLYQTHG